MNSWNHLALLRNGLGLLLTPVVLYGLFRWFEYNQVYHPSRNMDASGADLGRPWEEVAFSARDGTQLHGWYFPAEPTSARENFALLFCHGNAGNISHRLGTCQALLDLGVAVFVFDYRGFGRSSGRPSEEGTYQDAEAAHDWLTGKGFTQERIIAFGESLGGAAASELALRRTVCGLVLMSTFTSIPDVGTELFPWLPARWLCKIRYDTLSKLPRIHVPTLILHSQADTLIPYRHGERLFAAALEPKMLWEVYGDHNDTLLNGPERCQEGIRRFLAALEGRMTNRVAN